MTELSHIIKSFEKMLKRYKLDLEKNPDSTFYTGLVSNTENYIKELKNRHHESK